MYGDVRPSDIGEVAVTACVKAPSGRYISILLQASDTINSVKKTVAEIEDIPVSLLDIFLLAGGSSKELLKNGEALAISIIQNGSVVTSALRGMLIPSLSCRRAS